MFLHLSVSHSVHRGVSAHCMLGYTPQVSTPWAGTPLGRYPPGRYTPTGSYPLHSACWDTVNKRVVRIPMGCNLVAYRFPNTSNELLQKWVVTPDPC